MDPAQHLDGDSVGDFERSVAATAEAAHHLRRLFTLWLEATVDADAERRADIVLAVYEAVANATEHAYKNTAEPGVVTVHSRRRRNGALEITVTDSGTWDPSPSQRFAAADWHSSRLSATPTLSPPGPMAPRLRCAGSRPMTAPRLEAQRGPRVSKRSQGRCKRWVWLPDRRGP